MTTTNKGRSLSSSEIVDALSRLDPSCSRDEWIRIGMAVKAGGEEIGEDLFEEFKSWSSDSLSFDATAIAADWRSFGRGQVGKPISVGTLVYLAKSRGWIDPRTERVDLVGRAIGSIELSRDRPDPIDQKTSESIESDRAKFVKIFERDGFKIAAEYQYATDFFVYRLHHADGRKTIRPVSLDGSKWTAKAPLGLRPLFALAEIEAAPLETTVFVVEGEKCAIYAKSIGLLATTSSSGSESSHRTDWEPLRGRSVVIAPDRDVAGETYSTKVERILRGLSCEVRILRLSSSRQKETPTGFDIADWIDEREESTKEEQAKAIGDLVALERIVSRRSGASLLQDLDGFEASLAKTHGVEFIGLPCGCFTRLDGMLDGWQGLGVLAAEPGIGKTTLLLQAGLGIVSTNQDAAFVFLSLEMGRESMKRRLVCQATKIPYRRLRKGDPGQVEGEDGLHLSSRDREALATGLAHLRDLAPRISIIDSEDLSGLKLEDLADLIVERVQAFKSLSGCKRAFVVVDHLGRLPASEDSGLSSIGRDDARIATLLGAQRRLDEPLVVISQIRKSDFESPSMASTKGSAEIAYSPDFIITLRKTESDQASGLEDYGVGWTAETLLRADLVKGRDGMTRGKVEMKFLVDEQTIVEVQQ